MARRSTSKKRTKQKADAIAWKVESARLTLFSNTYGASFPNGILESIWGIAADEVVQRPAQSLRQERGVSDGLRLLATEQTGRLDIVLLGPRSESPEEVPPSFDNIGKPSNALEIFQPLASKLLSLSEGVTRLALGLH